MKTPSLIVAVEDVLQQGLGLLGKLTGEMYARPLDGTPAACSLGAHYRHVLDHFLCLVGGVRTDQVNYDRRQRNPKLEESIEYARLTTEGLIEEFRELSSDDLRRACTVTSSVGYGTSDADAVVSNLGRELMFCVAHAIHHYAILKMLCTGMGIELSYEFGIAPSTLKHLETQTAREA
jgi:uncharacterized damage-inducible protein DinB